MDDFIIHLTNQMNQKNFLENVKVPILEGHYFVPNQGTLFTAISDNKSIEQFLCDGILMDETFDDHIQKTIQAMKDIMNQRRFQKVEESIQFLKDYPTKDFFFKVYQQDNIVQDKICRQFLMFFMDKKTNAFYQLSYATPTYPLQEMDAHQEEFTTKSIALIDDLMNRVSY